MRLHRNLFLIYGAAFLRAAGVGLTGVILGIYLAQAGFSATLIGGGFKIITTFSCLPPSGA